MEVLAYDDDNMGATHEEVVDSLQDDVALAFKTCNEQRNRIARAESESQRLADELLDANMAWASKCEEVAALKAEIERLKAPVSPAEWLNLCAGDHVTFVDIQRHELDEFVFARAAAQEMKEPTE